MNKFLAILIILAWFSPAIAQEEQRGIIIVDGKKFFPLSGVRRYSGSPRPMPVTTEKRTQKNPVTIMSPHKKLEMAKPAAQTSVPPSQNQPAKSASETILSIFSPEESYSEKAGIKK